MATITEDMFDVIESAKLTFVATVRPDGTPTLSPRGSLRVSDSEHLIFADIASPQPVVNLQSTPAIKLRVSETAELLSPAYTIGHVREPELRQAWIEKYGLAEV